MKKVILYMVLSLDGFICDDEGTLNWEVRDAAVSNYLIPQLLETVDTILIGRVLYQGFEQAWPAMAKDPASPKELVEFARWIENAKKVVFSSTLTKTDWNNSHLVPIKDEHDIMVEVLRRKEENIGGDMVVFGGVRTAQTLIKLGLVDEYWFKIQPIVIGSGKALFSNIPASIKLTLIDAKGFDSGVVALRYKKDPPEFYFI